MTANLIETLVEWIDDQDDLVSIFPGGIWDSDAPTGTSTPLPYLTFRQTDSRMINIIGGKFVQFMTVNLESRAVYAATARTLGTQVRDRIIDDATRFVWAGGQAVGKYLTDGEGGELEEGRGPDGSDVWVHRIPIIFTTARG